MVYDGFMLCDCVCFNQKYNEVNGEENCDGINNNYSNNYGIEGLEVNFVVIEWWCVSVYVLLMMLLLVQGMLMLLVGDEQGYSQYGNNNVYCQDNVLMWLDWCQVNLGLIVFIVVLIYLWCCILVFICNCWWQEGDGNVCWFNCNVQFLIVVEWQQGVVCMQIQLLDCWLFMLNVIVEVVDMVLFEGEWCVVFLFVGEDNLVIMVVWYGFVYGVCVF